VEKTLWRQGRDEGEELGGRVIGYWLLVIGYWLLVIGYWLWGRGKGCCFVSECGRSAQNTSGLYLKNPPRNFTSHFHADIGDVGEGNSHRCGVAAFLNSAEVDHRAAVAGAQLIECGIEAPEFFIGFFLG
jgi:hypothetical protein